jgi:hypothetical protein
MALFGTKEGVNPHTRYPDAYYKPIWFDKRMYDGIELVAKLDKVSKKCMFRSKPATILSLSRENVRY